jgi:RIO-like serine/threonine protein kinase
LKRDPFGTVIVATDSMGKLVIQRDTRTAPWWAGWLARRLAAREARALAAAAAVPGIPRLVAFDGRTVTRSWIPGLPMFQAQPRQRVFYREALRLLRQLHRSGIAHNDLAKEPNWLCRDDGAPAIIDFQLASVSSRRGRIFRMLAREDLRHLLKHKRTYCPEHLTRRQRHLLEKPAWPSRWSRRLLKPIYLTITRRVLGWEDRDGATDRRHS